MDINTKAHNLLAKNTKLNEIIKNNRINNGNNIAYDILCFVIIYPLIINSNNNNSQHSQLNNILKDIEKDVDISNKIYIILDNIDNDHEKNLLMITIAHYAHNNQNFKEKIISIMLKYPNFNLILEIIQSSFCSF